MKRAPAPTGGTSGMISGDSILERVLAHGETSPAVPGVLGETEVIAWSEGGRGVLAGGRAAVLSASCLLRPASGDRVLAWSRDNGVSFVLAVLERAAEGTTAVLTSSSPLAIEAPRVGISARAVQIECEDLLTHAHHRHSVGDTCTETARVRVAQVGVDVRRATTVDDEVAGTFLQRAGTWISNTTRDARLKARTFLFD